MQFVFTNQDGDVQMFREDGSPDLALKMKVESLTNQRYDVLKTEQITGWDLFPENVKQDLARLIEKETDKLVRIQTEDEDRFFHPDEAPSIMEWAKEALRGSWDVYRFETVDDALGYFDSLESDYGHHVAGILYSEWIGEEGERI